MIQEPWLGVTAGLCPSGHQPGQQQPLWLLLRLICSAVRLACSAWQPSSTGSWSSWSSASLAGDLIALTGDNQPPEQRKDAAWPRDPLPPGGAPAPRDFFRNYPRLESALQITGHSRSRSLEKPVFRIGSRRRSLRACRPETRAMPRVAGAWASAAEPAAGPGGGAELDGLQASQGCSRPTGGDRDRHQRQHRLADRDDDGRSRLGADRRQVNERGFGSGWHQHRRSARDYESVPSLLSASRYCPCRPRILFR